MILKKSKGRDPVGLCAYVFGPGRSRHRDRARVLGGTLLGSTAKTLAGELAAIISIRPDVRHPLLHYSISLHPGDRPLSQDEAYALGEDLAWTLDIRCWTIIAHLDTPGRQHWHWIGSRVDEGGALTREHLRDYDLGMRFARRWERQLGLTDVATPQRPDRPHGRSTTTKQQGRPDREAQKRGKPLARDRLRQRLDSVESRGLSGVALRDALLDAGVDLDLRIAKGKPKGITWIETSTGERWKGSDLGRRYAAAEWLARNDLMASGGGRHGNEHGNVFQCRIDDPIVDVGSRRGAPEAACAKHACPRGASRLGRGDGSNGLGSGSVGCRGEFGFERDPIHDGLVAEGVEGPGATTIDRTGSPGGQRACRGDGAWAAPDRGTCGIPPAAHGGGGSAAGTPMGTSPFGGVDPLLGGERAGGFSHRSSVDLGRMALPDAVASGGDPANRNAGDHHPGLPCVAGGQATALVLSTRRGR